MDAYEAILVKALHSVLYPDWDAFLRRVKRYYSKNFHVPLPEVDDLTEEEVLQAFYEDQVEQMDEVDQTNLLDKLTETPEERQDRERKEKLAESRDDEFLNNLNKEVLSGTVRGPPKETKSKWVPKAKTIKSDQASKPQPGAGLRLQPEAPPAAAPVDLTPDIHLSFGSNLENEIPAEWRDMDPLGDSTRKR